MPKRLFRFTEKTVEDGKYSAEINTLPEFGDIQIGSKVIVEHIGDKQEGITDMINDFFERVLKVTNHA